MLHGSFLKIFIDNKQRLLAVTSTAETMNMTSSFSESESSFPQQASHSKFLVNSINLARDISFFQAKKVQSIGLQ